MAPLELHDPRILARLECVNATTAAARAGNAAHEAVSQALSPACDERHDEVIGDNYSCRPQRLVRQHDAQK
jgi:hypothetical protein